MFPDWGKQSAGMTALLLLVIAFFDLVIGVVDRRV
jgi:hypothetical protein